MTIKSILSMKLSILKSLKKIKYQISHTTIQNFIILLIQKIMMNRNTHENQLQTLKILEFNRKLFINNIYKSLILQKCVKHDDCKIIYGRVI